MENKFTLTQFLSTIWWLHETYLDSIPSNLVVIW